jgi:hypothetical protein
MRLVAGIPMLVALLTFSCSSVSDSHTDIFSLDDSPAMDLRPDSPAADTSDVPDTNEVEPSPDSHPGDLTSAEIAVPQDVLVLVDADPEDLFEVNLDTTPLFPDGEDAEVASSFAEVIADVSFDDIPADEIIDSLPPQPLPACDMKPYDWLPAEAVGDVVSYEEQFLYHLPPVLIEELIAEYGYALELPLTYTPRVFKLRYTTQDRGQLREATAMVGIPDLAAPGAPPTVGVPAALFLHGTTGYADKCAPSNSIEGAAAAVLPASAGFLAVAPDFLGLCGFGEPCYDQFHPYLVGEPTAIASLDAVRAALKLREMLVVDNDLPTFDGRLAAWGASQGGHAALFVDRFAPYYAPEFAMPCVVSVVPPANLAGEAAAALTSLSSAASMGIAFLTAAHLWYAPEKTLAALFNPDGPKDYSDYIPNTFPTTCNAKTLYKGAASLEDVFVAPALEALADGNLAALDPWGCFALENSLPTSSIPFLSEARLLFIIGENDNLVDREVERETFLQLCDQGYTAEFVECAGLGHTSTALESINIQLEWLFECLEDPHGVPSSACKLKAPETCSI